MECIMKSILTLIFKIKNDNIAEERESHYDGKERKRDSKARRKTSIKFN
jgi:hypothetical protein